MLIIVAYFLVNVLCEVSANQVEGIENIAKNLCGNIEKNYKLCYTVLG
jgi:hypothetical protein